MMTGGYFVALLTATTRALTWVFLASLPMFVGAAQSTAPRHQPVASAPSPELDPSTVVRTQVEALRTNSLLNEGIDQATRTWKSCR